VRLNFECICSWLEARKSIVRSVVYGNRGELEINVALACMQKKEDIRQTRQNETKKRGGMSRPRNRWVDENEKDKNERPSEYTTQRMNFLLCCPKGPAQKV